LDARTFAGDTSPYVEQVAVSARGFVGERVASPEALTYVTRLAPGVTLAAPPRVKGAFAFSEGTAGQLVVVADFVWAYALESPGAVTPSPSAAPVPGASLVVLHSVERYEWFPDKGYLPDDRGMRPGAGELYAFNVDCAQAAQGLISLPMTPQEAGEAPSLAQVLDPSTPPGRLPSSCA
jgi:hypothetical protein